MMKIRNGFISNSSSASFTLTIAQTKEEFLKDFASQFWFTYLSPKKFKEELSGYLNDYKESQKLKNKDKFLNFITVWDNIPRIEVMLKTVKKFEKLGYDKIDYYELVKLYFEFHKILIETCKLGIQIRGYTSCWNNVEDMGEIFKNIICNLVYLKKNFVLNVEDLQ